jgi:hypothetical protein
MPKGIPSSINGEKNITLSSSSSSYDDDFYELVNK